MNHGEDEKEEPVKKHARSHARVFIHRPDAGAGAVAHHHDFHRNISRGSTWCWSQKGHGREFGGNRGEDPEEWSGQTAENVTDLKMRIC